MISRLGLLWALNLATTIHHQVCHEPSPLSAPICKCNRNNYSLIFYAFVVQFSCAHSIIVEILRMNQLLTICFLFRFFFLYHTYNKLTRKHRTTSHRKIYYSVLHLYSKNVNPTSLQDLCNSQSIRLLIMHVNRGIERECCPICFKSFCTNLSILTSLDHNSVNLSNFYPEPHNFQTSKIIVDLTQPTSIIDRQPLKQANSRTLTPPEFRS